MSDVVSSFPLRCYPVSVGLVPSPSIKTAYQLIGAFLEKHSLDMRLFHACYSDLNTWFLGHIPDVKNKSHRTISSSHSKIYVSKKGWDARFSSLLPKQTLKDDDMRVFSDGTTKKERETLESSSVFFGFSHLVGKFYVLWAKNGNMKKFENFIAVR